MSTSTATTRSVLRVTAAARDHLPVFRTPVRGHAFAPRPERDASPPLGAAVRLRREPSNPADPLAVAVEIVDGTSAPWRIGYLDRAVAARLAPRLDAGRRLAGRIDGWVAEPEGRWRRPLLLVLPDDPPPRTRASTGAPPAVSPGGHVGRSTLERQVGSLWGRPPGMRRRTVVG